MRQDQYERLQSLHEELTDVFLTEADPRRWPGHGLEPASIDAQTRGDRYWSKKNAVATIALMTRISNLTDIVQRASSAGTDHPEAVDTAQDELDAQVRAAEKEAAKLLKTLQSGTAKAAFDAKVHGKR